MLMMAWASFPNHNYGAFVMLFYICRMNDEGYWEGLRSTHDIDYADTLCEFYANMFPSACVDVLNHEEYAELITSRI